MKLPASILLPLTLTLLSFASSSRAGESEPKALRDALLDYAWSLNSPARKIRIQFLPDGTVKCSDGSVSSWKITGDNTAAYGDGFPMVFDKSFTSYEGRNLQKKWKFHGARLERTAPSPVPSPTPELSPTPPAVAKSTLEIITQDGPLITDQVLSPLDMPSVPEATVSLWREDLLDEASEQAAACQPVYNQAALLIDAWKAALRERYKIVEETKYSGTVVDTTDMNSSRKTNLHLWDWLEYQRERDAAEKHEVRQQRTAGFFASGPPKRWADRSAILRAKIEVRYATFRRTRRELPTQTLSPGQQ